MNDQPLFRWIFIAIFVIALFMSGYFRRKARQSGEVIPRAREGRLIVAGRILFAAPLYLSIFAYMLNPNWMAWSRMSLPTWLRWLAAVVGLATLAFVSMSLVAANWFILAMALLAILVLALVVIPREETQLSLKFGQAYREYQQRTGRLVPRLSLRR